MAYEPGSYLQELEEEHKAGRHDDDADSNCPTCRAADDLEDAKASGFDTVDAYHDWMCAEANKPNPELEAAVQEATHRLHMQGKHVRHPTIHCDECVQERGVQNI